MVNTRTQPDVFSNLYIWLHDKCLDLIYVKNTFDRKLWSQNPKLVYKICKLN
jgi:hypothetical protein